MQDILHIIRKYGLSLTVIFFILTICYLLHSTKIQALTMSNSNFILQMGNLNSFAGKKTGSGFKLSDTGGQLSPGLYSGSGFKVRAGFQYISSIIRFRFSISQVVIDFGNITATNPVTRIQNLKVSNGSAGGYIVTATENHAMLTNGTGKFIPDTTCDDGTCTPSLARPWTSTLTYGFGYNCAGVSSPNVCTSGFTDNTYYRPFAASPSAQTVMASSNVGRNQEVQLTYKVNVSATQPAGFYTNVIQFVATPTF